MTRRVTPTSRPHPQPHPSAWVAAGWAWRLRAACDPTTAHLFYVPDDGETRAAKIARVAKAQALCAACPVRTPCRDWALASGDRWAIAGGTTPEQRGYWAVDGHPLRTATAKPTPKARPATGAA
jgi:WhiB family redox-sensing transcriptional regulator